MNGRKYWGLALFIILLISVSLYPSVVNAQGIDGIAKVRELLKAYKVSVGEMTDYYYQEVANEAADRKTANDNLKKMEDLEPTLTYLFDDYVFQLEWKQSAETRRDTAHSNYIYALDMLANLSSSSQTDPAAIMYWEGKRDTAYRNRESAEGDIATLSPIVEEAWKAYDEVQKEYDGYSEKYSEYDEKAWSHRVQQWYAAWSLCDYFRAMIDIHNSNEEEFGPCPVDYIESEELWDDRCPINDGGGI